MVRIRICDVMVIANVSQRTSGWTPQDTLHGSPGASVAAMHTSDRNKRDSSMVERGSVQRSPVVTIDRPHEPSSGSRRPAPPGDRNRRTTENSSQKYRNRSKPANAVYNIPDSDEEERSKGDTFSSPTGWSYDSWASNRKREEISAVPLRGGAPKHSPFVINVDDNDSQQRPNKASDRVQNGSSFAAQQNTVDLEVDSRRTLRRPRTSETPSVLAATASMDQRISHPIQKSSAPRVSLGEDELSKSMNSSPQESREHQGTNARGRSARHVTEVSHAVVPESEDELGRGQPETPPKPVKRKTKLRYKAKRANPADDDFEDVDTQPADQPRMHDEQETQNSDPSEDEREHPFRKYNKSWNLECAFMNNKYYDDNVILYYDLEPGAFGIYSKGDIGRFDLGSIRRCSRNDTGRRMRFTGSKSTDKPRYFPIDLVFERTRHCTEFEQKFRVRVLGRYDIKYDNHGE